VRRILAITALLATSCVTTQLTPEGAKVRVTSNPETVHGCAFIGEVKGADHMNGGLLGQGAAEETAMRELKNRTAVMGANVTLITTSHTNTSGSVQRGEAYHCDEKNP
jgi:Domain of unknown function (DUF4156)